MKKEKVTIKWGEHDRLYTRFGMCECGSNYVIAGARYCSECGEYIINPLALIPYNPPKNIEERNQKNRRDVI